MVRKIYPVQKMAYRPDLIDAIHMSVNELKRMCVEMDKPLYYIDEVSISLTDQEQADSICYKDNILSKIWFTIIDGIFFVARE